MFSTLRDPTVAAEALSDRTAARGPIGHPGHFRPARAILKPQMSNIMLVVDAEQCQPQSEAVVAPTEPGASPDMMAGTKGTRARQLPETLRLSDYKHMCTSPTIQHLAGTRMGVVPAVATVWPCPQRWWRVWGVSAHATTFAYPGYTDASRTPITGPQRLFSATPRPRPNPPGIC